MKMVIINTMWFTLSASSCEIPEKGVPLTCRIESPGRSPARSATEPSSTRDMYTPTPAEITNTKYKLLEQMVCNHCIKSTLESRNYESNLLTTEDRFWSFSLLEFYSKLFSRLNFKLK